jgi:hypothetical protein
VNFPQNEVAADNVRRKMENVQESPVGGVIEDVTTLARPTLAVSVHAWRLQPRSPLMRANEFGNERA